MKKIFIFSFIIINFIKPNLSANEKIKVFYSGFSFSNLYVSNESQAKFTSQIIQEIDGIVSETRPAAWGLSRQPPLRLLFWNKFGYPKYMITKNGGRFEDILAHWWFDDSKESALEKAMNDNTSLPVGEVEQKYWKVVDIDL